MLLLLKENQEVGDHRLRCYLEYRPETLADALDCIRRGEIVAAIFKNAVPPVVCAAAARRIDAYAEKEHYEGAAGVGRIGTSLYETQFGPDQLVDYFRTAEAQLEISRSMFPPGRYPLDEMRLWLDDVWPHEVGRLRLEHGLCALGLIRFLDGGGAILPHNDVAAADMQTSMLAQAIDTQIAVNVLIQGAEAGGATRVYPKRFSRNEYDANRRPAPDGYALREECLPPDPVVIRPEAGDLYLFDANFPHAVEECVGARPRFTLSCFIGVRRNGELALFS